MMPEFETIELTCNDYVAHARLNRPAQANAMSERMWGEFRELAEWADRDPEVRVLVISGAGKHFTAGIDLQFLMQFQSRLAKLPDGYRQEEMRRVILDLQESFSALARCRKPVIAAIHGSCYGGGIDLVTACDLRYATADARFCVKEIDLAIVADVGTLQRLPGIVAEGVARELAFTGRVFPGTEAAAMGLVNQTSETEEALMEHVMQVANTIAAKSPLAMRGTKAILNYTRDHGIADGLDYVATWNSAVLQSSDLQEAVTAFMQKREPVFKAG